MKMRHIKKVLKLSATQALSVRDIEKVTGLPRSTVNDYIKRFSISDLTTKQLEELNEAQIYRKLFSEPARTKGKVRPDFSYIYNELKQPHVTRQLLWEEYKEKHPDGFGYTQFCYHLAEWTKTLNISMRQIHRGGEKLFIDYSGLKATITDPRSGATKEVEVFVCTLGASGYTYAEASPDQKLASFIGSHIKAFAFYEGVTRILVPDNLKAAVTKADRYDPVINESYQDMADHYHTVVIPARPYKPQDKSKVELAVKLVQRWILARIRKEVFFSIEELNVRLRECLEYYNHKVIRSLGKSRHALYLELDKPALQALPALPYEFKEINYTRVAMDYHIDVAGNFYSVPYQLKSKEVQVRFNTSKVAVYYDQQRVALHPRLTGNGQASTFKEHMPEAHRAYAGQDPSALIQQGLEIGSHTACLIRKLLEENSHPEKNYRRAAAILRAARKHNNPKESELASAKMLALNIRRVAHFESILKRKAWKLDDGDAPLLPPANRADEHVRGAEYYH
jgi:transposase